MSQPPKKSKTMPQRSGTVRSSGAFNSGAGGGGRGGRDWYDIGGLAPPLEKGAVVDGFLVGVQVGHDRDLGHLGIMGFADHVASSP